MPPKRRGRVGWKVVLVILIGVALHLLLVHLSHSIQKQYGDLFRAAIVILVGGAVSYLVEQSLNRSAVNTLGPRRATSFRFLARLLLYLALVLALLAAFGVGLSSVVFGSAFFTVILGLAGQNFFGNLIAGMGLVLFHPFEVGDHISFVASQYGLLMPSFPHEQMKPAYSGVVQDINLAYTTLDTDDGIPMTVPNGVMIQAAIENRKQQRRLRFRFRFDMDLAIDPGRLLPMLQADLARLPYPVDIQLADVGAATFAIVATGIAESRNADPIRHAILEILIPLAQRLRVEPTAPISDSH